MSPMEMNDEINNDTEYTKPKRDARQGVQWPKRDLGGRESFSANARHKTHTLSSEKDSRPLPAHQLSTLDHTTSQESESSVVQIRAR